ncbi:MAG: terminase TerL endonuclease subunit [Solirubrobacteraceae bacterium]
MNGRPPKTLAQLVRDGSFRARRDTHRLLLAGPALSWQGFALLQQRFVTVRSEAERREVAREFEQAVKLVHAQTAAAQAQGAGRSLADELALLGKPGSAKQLLEFFPSYLVHPKGPLRGQPFQLEPWQRRFLREFYRRDKQGRRVYRLGVLAIPRGNGKTALAAALGLYELIARGDAPEVYFAAASKEQARVALSFARSFVEEGPLAEWVTVKSTLSCPSSNGTLQVLSSMGTLLHGRAPAAAIVDELWAFETRTQQEAYPALTSALHKRVDSYLLAITTAGFDKRSLLGRIYEDALRWPQVQTSRNGCLTIAKDEANGQLLWWYGAPADAETEDPKIWRACNPASFVDLRDLRRQLHDPGLGELGFRRLHLNQWTAARDSWLPAGTWASLQNETKIPDGAAVYVGVDVGLNHDTTAVAWAHRLEDGRIIIRARVWSANDKAAAHQYIAGGKVQLEEVEQFILELAKRFTLREVAYDPRFFERSAELLEKHRLTTVEFLQASGPMVDAYQRFYQLAVTGALAHNGDAVLAAHIDATAARPSERGWKISKLKSRLVIDATVAAAMAVARADINGPQTSNANVYWLEY